MSRLHSAEISGVLQIPFLSLLVAFLTVVLTDLRTLEDIEDYYRTRPSVFVFRDKDAIRSKRPQKYIEKHEEDLRRASSADPRTFRRSSRISYNVDMDDYEAKTEKGRVEIPHKEVA